MAAGLTPVHGQDGAALDEAVDAVAHRGLGDADDFARDAGAAERRALSSGSVTGCRRSRCVQSPAVPQGASVPT